MKYACLCRGFALEMIYAVEYYFVGKVRLSFGYLLLCLMVIADCCAAVYERLTEIRNKI